MKPYKPNMAPGYEWAEDLPDLLWDDLAGRPPEEAAGATGADWAKGRFFLPVFGRRYSIDPESRRIEGVSFPEERVDYNTGVVLVTHLARARDVLPAGRMVSFKELPSGETFFSGPHALPMGPIIKRFGNDFESLVRRARELGGKEVEGGDVAVCLPGLRRVPMYVMIWKADDEFPAEAVPGVDANVMHHLALDGLFALSHLMVQRLTESENP